MLKTEDLHNFSGTNDYHRWSMLFPRHLLTDGAKHVAENGGEGGAYWLMDAIASHQPRINKNADGREMAFWTLEVKPNKSALLTADDGNGNQLARQRIPYTDFDPEGVKLYCQRSANGWVIMLPSEY